MITLLIPLAVGGAASLLLTPVVRYLATRWGLVDHPDGRRKMHRRPMPVAGGLAILGATLLAILTAWLFPTKMQEALSEQGGILLGLGLAALVICAVGVADDFGRLRARQKVLGQLVAIVIMMGSGVMVRHIQLFGWSWDLGIFAGPFTILWLLGAMNSLNLIDGMDGLLTTVGTIICSAMALMAILGGQWATACIAMALVGALLGFLRYNFPPASIFLGDSGSMLIGLVVGVLAIQSSLKSPATIALAAPVALLTVPFFDTLAAITRRKLTGRSIYTTDRGHLHHCLLGRGFSSRRALLCVSLCCLLTVAGVLVSLAFNNESFAIVSALAVVGMLIATRLFGYAEFLLVKNRLMSVAGSFFQAGPEGLAKQSEVRLQGSANWEVLWNELTEWAGRLNLRTVCFDVNAPAMHEGYHARWQRPQEDGENPSLWRAELPLIVQGQTVGRLQIVGQRDLEPIWMKLASLTNVMEATLSTLTRGTKPIAAAGVGSGGYAFPRKQLQPS
jgi:UDP-GlcNAc:undecaprenyl-phosphate/decaprenyl-phosphate GlcNAc-1-phosphate transferase